MAKKPKGRLCVVHNNVSEASSRLEVTEQRVVAYLTSLIDKDDVAFKSYPVAVRELADLLGLSRGDFYKEIKQTTKGLVGKTMSLKHLDDSPGELQVAWLSAADYQDGQGVVELEFSPKLKPYLLQLKDHFTAFPLNDVIKFKSQFSMPIYLLLKQYLTIGHRKIEIDELKRMLEITDKYKQYGVLKLKVLLVAVAEINEKTSIRVTFDEIRADPKAARRITAIKFWIKEKPETPEESAEAVLLKKLQAAGISFVKAAELVGKHTAARIEANLQVGLSRIAAAKKKGESAGPGLIVTAIEGDYAGVELGQPLFVAPEPAQKPPEEEKEPCPICGGKGVIHNPSAPSGLALCDCKRLKTTAAPQTEKDADREIWKGKGPDLINAMFGK